MQLYLIRHADAIPLGEAGIIDDPSRPLTAKGEAQAKLVGEGLSHRGIKLQTLLTSPLVRARQTADGIAKHCKNPSPEVRLCEDLAPAGKRRKLSSLLRDLGKDVIGLVGHQPDLGEFAAWLIGSRKAEIELAKGGVACIECEGDPGKGEGKLEWLVTPEWFQN